MVQSFLEFRCTIRADYHQFTITLPDGGQLPVEIPDTPLASYWDEETLTLVSARQWGEIPVDVRIHPTRPEPLGDDWLDVVEVSLVATEQVYLCGWGGIGESLELPVEHGTSYRLRYAISDMDAADDDSDDAPTEKYLLDLWPESASSGAVTTAKTSQGRYWLVSRGVERIKSAIHTTDDDATEEARITQFANQSLDAYPDLVDRLNDQKSWAWSTMSWAAFALFRGPGPGAVGAQEQMAWQKATRARTDSILRAATESWEADRSA